MKNKNFFVGILLLVPLFVMMFAGCDLIAQNEKLSITINGNPKMGETLTVTFSGDFSGCSSDWDWQFADSPNSTNWVQYIQHITRTNITLNNDVFVGQYVRVSRYSYDNSKYVYSNVIGPVQP